MGEPRLQIAAQGGVTNNVAVDVRDMSLPPGSYEATMDDGTVLPVQITALSEGKSLIGVLIPNMQPHTRLIATLREAGPTAKGIDLLDQPENGRIVVNYSGFLQTIYHYGAQNLKPRFYPITVPCAKLGPMEDPDTVYPKSITDDSPPDHIWHRSLWYACGDLNGVDFYLENGGEGRIVHERFTDLFSGPVFGGFREELSWVAPDGRRMLKDERRFTMYRRKGVERVFDIAATFTALDEAATFGATNENALPLIRVADLIDEWDGGQLTLDGGIIGGTDGVGKRAKWADYSGPLIRKPGKEPDWWGIAMLDHPSNRNHPNAWFARSYGPLGTNLPFFDGPLTLQPGESWELKHRIIVHPGKVDVQKMDHAWYEYWDHPAVAVI